jgi:AraC-like DNA-binding protein
MNVYQSEGELYFPGGSAHYPQFHQKLFACMQFTDPLAFEEFLSPIGGEVRIRPMCGSQFRGNIEIRTLNRVGLFSLETDSFWAQKRPAQDFYGFSIPLSAPFTISAPGYDQTFGHPSAHMLSPGQAFTFQCKKRCSSLVANFFVDTMTAYKERMLQEKTTTGEVIGPQVPLMSPGGSELYRSVVRAWVTLGNDKASINDIATRELEDDLPGSFLLLSEGPPISTRLASLPSDTIMSQVEDYICANLDASITRDAMSELAGVSIRSLSRAFRKKFGLGPMDFVRQRRLDACFAQLQGSSRDETTVTEVAMRYGFWHTGKFANAYRAAFGETPSESLQK